MIVIIETETDHRAGRSDRERQIESGERPTVRRACLVGESAGRHEPDVGIREQNAHISRKSRFDGLQVDDFIAFLHTQPRFPANIKTHQPHGSPVIRLLLIA